jgi:hypothetical protein
MKVHELLENKTTIEDLIARLERVGGQVYGEIIKGDLVGKLGVNGKGKHKVYFAFYPDGTSQRFEHQPSKDDLKPGWKAQELRDPETVKAETDKADRASKAQRFEDSFEDEIRLSDGALKKVCDENHIHMGEIADAWIDDKGVDALDLRGRWKKSGREVAWAIFNITLKNEDWRGEDDKDNVELHDPIHVKVWRDDKNPQKYHAEQTDLG